MDKISQENLEKLPHKLQVRFAVFCAEQVTDLLDDKTRDLFLKAIEVTKLWLEGKATKEDCKTAADAAAYAIYSTYTIYAAASAAYYAANAAYYAANTTCYATQSAGYAADAYYAAYSSTNKKQIAQAQWDYYYELLNIDTNLEKILLGA